MSERRQHRFFLTGHAVDLLYTNDHQHPSPREEARAVSLAAFHPQGELRQEYRERFALDHDHPVHLENQGNSPFVVGEQPAPATTPATSTRPGRNGPGRGKSLRRLAMLEPVYRLAPDLIRNGRASLPADDAAATRDARMTDFCLLRHGGFYHAVARYGENVWTTFTYAGLHVSERVLQRKEQHRLWGVDCCSSEEDRYFRIGNRTFYEEPGREVEPSAQVVVAVDAWTRELARSTLRGDTPTIFCTPDGHCTPAVQLRPSRDLVSDPSGHPSVGRPERVELWLRRNPDIAAIDGRLAHRLFLALCQFPAMRASWLQEIVGGNPSEISRHLRRFVDTGLVAVFDGRHYLSDLGDAAGGQHEPGAARHHPPPPRSLPGRWYREHEQHHDDGVNRLVVRFARRAWRSPPAGGARSTSPA